MKILLIAAVVIFAIAIVVVALLIWIADDRDDHGY
jgi:hypothetical protein